MKTFSPKPHDIERRWYVIDADGAVLGRLASEVAKILRGKHKPIFAPHADTGDHVIVINARRVRLTGGKEEKKVAYRHSGYPGGIRGITYARLMAERPAMAVERAVRGMLPKNRLGRQMARKLAVYEGPEHPHQSQRPEPLPLGQVPKWTGLPKPKPRPAPATPTEEEKKKRTGRKGTAKASTAKRGSAKPSTAKRGTAKTSTARKRTAKASTADGRTERSGTGGASRRARQDKDSETADTPAGSSGGTRKTGRTRRSKGTKES